MTNVDTTSIVIVGVGGQGILLASAIIARAAMNTGFDVKTNEVHGMAQRGGSVIGQIRYGAKVNSPLVALGSAKVIGSFEEVEAIRWAHYLDPAGLAVVSSQQVIPVTVSSGAAHYPTDGEKRVREIFKNLIFFNATEIAREMGDQRMANTIVLGAMSNGVGLPIESWQEAIKQSIKEKYRDINFKAFNIGRSFKS